MLSSRDIIDSVMNKIDFLRLWDLYGGLLTPTQRDRTDLYFNLDLTVSEIAEQKGISRQAVSECLGGCKRELALYEEKLGHAKMLDEGECRISSLRADALKWAEQFESLHPEYAGDMAVLRGIVAGDCPQDIASSIKK